MANPGGVGSKFVSVNLNKSYGQPSHHTHQSYTGSYGQLAASRGRPGSGGSGGMVVLSRPRSSHKAVPKLSVLPPLNLPSLRKEHERFDVLGSGSGATGSGRPGSGPRPSSSGMSWNKPAPATGLHENDGTGDAQVTESMDQRGDGINGSNRVNSAYVPPLARPGGIGTAVPGSAKDFLPLADKATVFRGEDFPSLQAALPIPSGPPQKQKDCLNQKQNLGEQYSDEVKDDYNLRSLVDMCPQGHSSCQSVGNGPVENGVEGNNISGDQARKQEEYFPAALLLVQLDPRSDWADDERDTGHRFVDRARDMGMTRSENYWDRGFNMLKTSALPHKAAHNQYERWSQRDNETGNRFSSEVKDPHSRDLRTPSREGSMWRSSPLHRDGNALEAANDRNTPSYRVSTLNRDMKKDSKYSPAHFGEGAWDGGVSENRDSTLGKNEMIHVLEGQHYWNSSKEPFNSGGSKQMTQEHYDRERSNRYGVDGLQNGTGSKPFFASSGKMLPITDPILNFVREKHAFSRNEKPYKEDPFVKGFGSAALDETDLFSGSLVSIIKRKKDVVKHIDLHDPVRESFEAELERVQKMQELERQRIMEEQERAMEQARKEEEERLRLIREEEERWRMLEEEAREAAWRAEQEQMEAMRRAEEQRIAREEERRMAFLEEERRKEAAKKKLLELEAKIAKRQVDVAKADTSIPNTILEEKNSDRVKENDAPLVLDLDNWNESGKMVESLTTCVSSETPVLNRPPEISSRPYPPRETFSTFPDRGKSINSWRRDALENRSISALPLPDQEIDHYSSCRDPSAGAKAPLRKEFYSDGYVSSRGYVKGGVQEAYTDEFGHPKEHRSPSVDANSFNRNREMDSELNDNCTEKYNEIGWGQGRSRGNTHFPYPDRLYQNSEEDESFSYGKVRYSMRQPRVLPPPTLATMRRSSFKVANGCTGPSNFVDNENRYSQSTRSRSAQQMRYYGGHSESFEPSEVDLQQDITTRKEKQLKKDVSLRCDSQSSLSVTSPPNSPPHLSHDELDESGDSPLVSTTADGKEISLSGNECIALNDDCVQGTRTAASSSISAIEDDEWTLEDNDNLPRQEEYDEDENGYQEDDEVREGDDENIDQNKEFEDLHLEDGESTHKLEELVIGFDEGVEVAIPSDDFERNSRNGESIFGRPDTVSSTGKQGALDGVQVDECGCQPAECPQSISDNSSGKAKETEKSMHEVVIKPTNISHISVMSDTLDGVDAPGVPSLSAQQMLSSIHRPSSPSQTGPWTTSSASDQTELPVKLQFGLFSGPSLVPSPVPAIQIGSIQMPLHLHPPVGPPFTHIHSSQPPVFQFGQLRYSSPISQGILPVGPQSMSFVQPHMQGCFNANQGTRDSLLTQPAQDASTPGFVLGSPVQSLDTVPPGLGSTSATGIAESNDLLLEKNTEASLASDRKLAQGPGSQPEDKERNNADLSNDLQPSKRQTAQPPIWMVSNERSSGGMRAEGSFYGSKGKRLTYAVKSTSLRSSIQAYKASLSGSSGFQRRPRRTVQQTKFRIRENADRRQSSSSISVNDSSLDGNSNNNGRTGGGFTRCGSKRGSLSSKPLKQTVESVSSKSGEHGSQEVDTRNKARKDIAKEAIVKSQNLPNSVNGNLKRNLSEDVDAPLQSGVVRVFNQPGIETPSDEDDFIEVRSKRQMLNDRREQREKEIKAKSRASKPTRKPHATRQSIAVSTSQSKISAHVGGEIAKKTCSNFASTEGQGSANKDTTIGFSTIGSQPLASITMPFGNAGDQADIRSNKLLQTTTGLVLSGSGNDAGANLIFESKKNGDVVTLPSLGSWDTVKTNHQVMALTQGQLEEAMNPARFVAQVSSVGGHSSSVSEPTLPSSLMLVNEKTFSSVTSPINSLLAGEKIQFGAVTSPTIIPVTSHVVSHGIGALGSNRSDAQILRNLSTTENDCALFFDEDKPLNNTAVNLQDSEAEAEAAASAVAVAAISSDEIVGNVSVAASESKSYEGDQQLGSQSRTEEFLSVSLPADLSVETPPISLWPPLPSPHNSSSQVLSHFPGGLSPHFPFYEVNPVLAGPIFAFGPHEESAGMQSQSQKTAASNAGPLGTWQHCHSSVDSFYGPPTGFTGAFVSPPGGIPGVQGPPHMVVYNHFAPIGQFGQVGLRFMGTTYLPSGKHPEWKQSPSAMGINEGGMNNVIMSSTPHNVSNMPAPIQHLCPGSPLMPMASPLAMFDVSPLQSSPDMPVEARWSHVPSSPLHSLPLSRLPQQSEDVLPSQFCHGHSTDQSSNISRPPESHLSTTSDSGPSFTVAADSNADSNAAQLPDELGLVDSSRSATTGAPIQNAVCPSSESATDGGKSDTIRDSIGNNVKDQTKSAFKIQSPLQKNASTQQSHSTDHRYQRGGRISQQDGAGNEWFRRRTGFHTRNQSFGSEKGFPSTRVRQIYVAKQTTNVPKTAGRAI